MARASIGVLVLVLAFTAHASAQAPASAGPPAGEGRELLTGACTSCHGLNTIMAMRDGPAGWRLFVYDMILRGAQLTQPEAESLIAYLVKSFGPGVPLARSAETSAAAAPALPAGAGRELVTARCTLCHGIDRVVSATRTAADWDSIVKGMAARGPAVPESEVRQIAAYLKEHYGN